MAAIKIITKARGELVAAYYNLHWNIHTLSEEELWGDLVCEIFTLPASAKADQIAKAVDNHFGVGTSNKKHVVYTATQSWSFIYRVIDCDTNTATEEIWWDKYANKDEDEIPTFDEIVEELKAVVSAKYPDCEIAFSELYLDGL